LSCLLLEKDDFGQHTSFNNLRIVHGGLRYLQTLDFHRFRESYRERSWFLRHFPHLIRPLPCMMPLYGNGLRRPAVMQCALLLNDLLSGNRNHGIEKDRRIPNGKVIDARTTAELFPAVDRKNLRGAATWYDAYMPDSPRIIIELLRTACGMGAFVLNYCEVRDLVTSRGKAAGVDGNDRTTGKTVRFEAPVVVNTAGPWTRKLAAKFDADYPELFRPSLAWNLLLNRPALSAHAVALAPKKPNARTYFVLPYKGKMLAGTGHSPWHSEPSASPMPDEVLHRDFLADLNRAVPGLNLSTDDISLIFTGFLPAKHNGTAKLAVRETILDHFVTGGPKGLVSVSGVKFTTSRLVVEKTLNTIMARYLPGKASKKSATASREDLLHPQTAHRLHAGLEAREGFWEEIQKIIDDEAVVHLDDLVCRRTSLWEDRDFAPQLAERVSAIAGWDRVRQKCEIDRLTMWYQRRTHPKRGGQGQPVVNQCTVDGGAQGNAF
jgi:glycerol-3-phosphate dehydrogenase